LGSLTDYKTYIKELLKVWRECERVLKPNGKLCINVPLMPMFKRDLNTHYNRQFLTYKAIFSIAF
ncbi:site-specific DNA-methyltransferase, partial [Campylobacter upsaliensis]|nr:site-specific DNA-methyltransferase [Campylobacter upsaliensis]